MYIFNKLETNAVIRNLKKKTKKTKISKDNFSVCKYHNLEKKLINLTATCDNK